MGRFKRVLVANRGEIALRIIKSLKEMGIETVAVYSNADKELPYVRLADIKVCLGEEKDSYLNAYKILSAASVHKVDAIHPGIGFMAESSEFAKLCENCKIVFIGPNAELIDAIANKSKAKQLAKECLIPTIAGVAKPVPGIEACREFGLAEGYPIVLKATHGGGGKGIRVVERLDDLNDSFELCVKEARAAFNNGELMVEKAVQEFKHIEVQILADAYGNVVHLGDRECTIQRSKQKIIEEARCQNISMALRQAICEDAMKIARHIHYIGPGTVEFLIQNNEQYYFMEVNTRLQVEHTITELITGIDIVKEQIKIFEGEELSFTQNDIHFSGYALQCRIIAEDTLNGAIPSLGKITKWNMPGGLGVRVDSGYGCGNTVTPYFDSLIAKISCHAANKEEAIKKMMVCLEETEIGGIKTNLEFLRYILSKQEFLTGDYTENFMSHVITAYEGESEY